MKPRSGVYTEQAEEVCILRRLFSTLLLAVPLAFADSGERRLPEISVHEWGVISFSGPDLLFSGVPDTQLPFPLLQPDQYLLRAPVLYFHGPEFSGRVTVRTDNGFIFHTYPEPCDLGMNGDFVSWTGSFSYDHTGTDGEPAPSPDGALPASLWRTGEAMTVHTPSATEGFLYYETAPETLDFLPLIHGTSAIPEEWMNLQALVIRGNGEGGGYGVCELGALADIEGLALRAVDPDEIHRTLLKWSRDVIDVEEVNALWNTWADWFCRDHAESPDYSGGLVVYRVPEELLHKLSTIEVEAAEPAPYPCRVRRYILAAVPL